MVQGGNGSKLYWIICITVIEPLGSTAHESVCHSRHAILITAIIWTGCKEGGQWDPHEGRGKRVWSWLTGTGRGQKKKRSLLQIWIVMLHKGYGIVRKSVLSRDMQMGSEKCWHFFKEWGRGILIHEDLSAMSLGRIFILYMFLCDGVMSIREHFPLVAISWFQRMAHCKGIWHVPLVLSHYTSLLLLMAV
jgi:hypothetical protein